MRCMPRLVMIFKVFFSSEFKTAGICSKTVFDSDDSGYHICPQERSRGACLHINKRLHHEMKRRQWLWLQQTDLSRITLEIAMSTEEKTTQFAMFTNINYSWRCCLLGCGRVVSSWSSLGSGRRGLFGGDPLTVISHLFILHATPTAHAKLFIILVLNLTNKQYISSCLAPFVMFVFRFVFCFFNWNICCWWKRKSSLQDFNI